MLLKLLKRLVKMATAFDKRVQKVPGWVKVLMVLGFLVGVGGGLYWLTRGNTVAILETRGEIADKQKSLMLTTLALSLIVVIPVFIMLFSFAWKYKDKKGAKSAYKPEWASSKILEFIWWGLPIALITVLAVMTWNSTRSLDPYRPLESSKKPLVINVVALQWKWLFIYPDEKIASVNDLTFPVDTPVRFDITSDAPMNSFWIPQLGGQIYAMAAMQSQLNLISDQIGSYDGVSANLSGEGFADMKFKANVVSQKDYDAWTKSLKSSTRYLDKSVYARLSQPGVLPDPSYYSLRDPSLYTSIVESYHKSNGNIKYEDGHGN